MKTYPDGGVYILKIKLENKKDFNFELSGKGECFLAQILKESGGKTLFRGFGFSDCSCSSHLIYFSLTAGKKAVEELIDNRNLTAEFNNFKK